MYQELADKKSDLAVTDKTWQLKNARISDKLRLLRTSLLCTLAFLLGLITAYALRGELALFDREISEYFGIFSGSDQTSFINSLLAVSYKELFVLLLISLSSLTFFCSAMSQILLGVCAVFYGICSGALIFGSNIGLKEIVYIAQSVLLVALFACVAQNASSFNRIFLGKRNSSRPAKHGVLSISPQMVKYILITAVYIIIFLTVKLVYCILQFKIQ